MTQLHTGGGGERRSLSPFPLVEEEQRIGFILESTHNVVEGVPSVQFDERLPQHSFYIGTPLL